MRTAGVICECNPLHEGHRYLLRRAKESGAEAVICVMSGDFVQRGEAAILDARTRAEILREGGADAIFELPFPFCSSGAEFFARAGVNVLARLGASELWFGSECGSIDRLDRLAVIARSEDFQAAYAASVRSENGTAARYVSLLQSMEGSDAPISPNDLLGIAYLRALKEGNFAMRPVTLKRVGSGYAEETVRSDQYPSATALRALLKTGDTGTAKQYLTDTCYRLLNESIERGDAPAALENAERLILGYFRLHPKSYFENIAELSGGLGARLCEAAKKSADLEEMLSLAATKKYPRARLQRGILFALTGITPEDLRTSPAYTRLLAANETGHRFLASIRKTAQIPIVTRSADYPKIPEAIHQRELEQKAERLYDLCRPSMMKMQ